MQRLDAKLRDFSRGVLTFERREVHHRHGGFQTPELGSFFLMRTSRERGRTGLHTHLVHGANVIDQAADG